MKASRIVSSWLISLALVLLTATPTGAEKPDCADTWSWSHSLEFPPGFWQVGPHNYDFHILSPDGELDFHNEFQSSADAQLYKGQVHLRLSGLRWDQPDPITEITPQQDTLLQLSWLIAARDEAEDFRAATTFEARWDGGAWVDIAAGPLTKTCAAQGNPAIFDRRWGPRY